MSHCELLQDGDIQVVVGDASRDGPGGRQYAGIWSLTSKHRQFNAFGNSYAGLLPGLVRGKNPVFGAIDTTTAVLTRSADQRHPTDVEARYCVKPPYYVDHTLWFVDRSPVHSHGQGFREVSWCSYMNCPDDPRLHFLSNGRWTAYISPEHGSASNLAPSYRADVEPVYWPQIQDSRPFRWDLADVRFDQPFYYGRLDNMVLIFIFDTPRCLRFYCSPSGGGQSLLPGRSCPAWDFLWVIPSSSYRIETKYTFRCRLVYKPFVSNNDVLDEVNRTQQELGFERV